MTQGKIATGAVTSDKLAVPVYTQTEVNDLVTGLQGQITAMQDQIAALQDLLQHFSRNGNEITIAGANLNIVSGSGTTDGQVNGLGNLVIGYNEVRGYGGDDRSGSHNMVVGTMQNYTSFGGFIAGVENSVTGSWASVTGGNYNTASGSAATVSGGHSNQAQGTWSSVSGGQTNVAAALWSSVSGGFYHSASGNHDWAAGSLWEGQ